MVKVNNGSRMIKFTYSLCMKNALASTIHFENVINEFSVLEASKNNFNFNIIKKSKE